MHSNTLWRDNDERALELCRDALDRSDLVTALFAIEGASPATAKRARGQLALWAEFVTDATQSRAPFEQAAALKRVLGEDVGFTGNESNYYDPRNCDLSQVLNRRRGLPIVLSAVWIAVGQRAGFDVHGIGLPGHFICRVGNGEGAALCDPYKGGEFLTQAQCKKRVADLTAGRVPWRDSFMNPVTNEQIAYRVLRNRAHCSQREGDEAGRYRAARLLARLTPRELMHSVLEGQAAEAIGAVGAAQDIYERVARASNGQPGRLATEALRRLRSDPRGTLH